MRIAVTGFTPESVPMADDHRTDPFDAQPPPLPDERRTYPYDDRRRDYAYDDRAPEYAARFPPLPSWLARKHLRPDEQVVWVAGPRFNPSWERYFTHPLLFVAALFLGALCVILGMAASSVAGAVAVCGATAFVIVVGSLAVLGLCCGYFTRLVATTHRVLILQGYEACRQWGIHQLPSHMVRYRRMGDVDSGPTIDVDAMKTMLGGASDQFVDAKTILSFGKELNRMRRPDERR